MTGPHPAVAAARLAVRRELAQHRPGDVVLVACSGGADSLALAAATVFEARALAQRVVGVTVDHALQAGSAEQATRVVAQLAALGVGETASIRVSVESGPRGVEAGAREARYAALAQLAEHFEAVVVLLGHTRDDQAETVLLGLTHGSGTRALAGMRRGYDVFRRPFLDLTRAQTVATCTALDLEYWDDPHNADPAYARVRVRTRILPALETELGPGIAAALARTADLARADADLLDELAEDAFTRARHESGWSVAALADLAPALRRRVLRLAALDAGAPALALSAGHVAELDRLLTDWHGQVGVDLPGGVTAVRHADALCFERR